MLYTPKYLCLIVFLLGLTTAALAAEPKSLIDLAGEDPGVTFTGNGGRAEITAADTGKVLVLTLGEEGGSYPGVNIEPASKSWDLTGYGAVRFTVTNKSDVSARVHGRVDNAGDWKKSPWSVNAVTLKAGESRTLSVPFGKSYNNPGYELDPAKVVRVVVFVEKPKQPITLHVTAIEAVEATAAAPAKSEKPTASGNGGNEAGVAPKSNVLYDFESPIDPSLLVGEGTTHEMVDSPAGGKALRVSFEKGKYPGLQLNAPGKGWDLRNFAGVEVELTNTGSETVVAALRVDNPGDWKKQPWNVEKIKLKTGETKPLRVTFGQSWGSPGFAINPARIIRAVVYAENPKAGSQVRVDNLRAFGQPVAREADAVDLGGMLFDFGPDFILAGRAKEQGATARVEDGRLVVEFATDESWPAVALTPVAKQWDLSIFESVQAEVTNLADAPVRIGIRIDNPGAPKNSNTEQVTIPAGKTETVKVTFGQSWGKPGPALDPAKVISLLIFADKPKSAARIAVDNIKANAKAAAEVPEWIGQRPPVEGDWVQTLNENFDGSTLDTSKWTPRLVWDGPAHAETQRFLEKNVYVEDGKLVIKCERNPGHQYDNPNLATREYATGAVTTLDKWTQTYGYFEARIKRPSARGLWPAFWMMPDRGPGAGDIWARRTTSKGGMEIDIWEHLTEWGPGRYNIAAHWDGYERDHKQWGNAHTYHLPTEDGWHHFGLLWEPGKLTWYCDGRKVGQWENERVTQVPLYLKFTVQMGNWATKNVDVAALPDFFQIDYVRAWQLRERMKAE